MAITQMTSALSHKPSVAVGAAAPLRCQPLQTHSLQHTRCLAATGISARIGPQQAARSATGGRMLAVAARASALQPLSSVRVCSSRCAVLYVASVPAQQAYLVKAVGGATTAMHICLP